MKKIEEQIVLKKYLDEEFIPRNLKRKVCTDGSSDTLEYYYIDSKKIDELEIYDKEEIIKYIQSKGIEIELEYIDEYSNIKKPNKRKYKSLNVKYLSNLFDKMNNSQTHEEYINMRNTIFELYIDYPNHIICNYANNYGIRTILEYNKISLEDFTHYIYEYILEAIEKYINVNLPFSVFLRIYVERSILKLLRPDGYGIRSTNHLIKIINNILDNNIDINTLLKDNEYVQENYRVLNNVIGNSIDISSIDVEDIDSNVEEKFFDIECSKINRELLIDLILNLDTFDIYKRKSNENCELHKKLLILYYGLDGNKPKTLDELAIMFNNNVKWVSNKLLDARKRMVLVIAEYNSFVEDVNKLYIK